MGVAEVWFRVLVPHDHRTAVGSVVLLPPDAVRTKMLVIAGYLEPLDVPEVLPEPELKLKPAEPPKGTLRRGRPRGDQQAAEPVVRPEAGELPRDGSVPEGGDGREADGAGSPAE
jgi:hypothetical protein